MKSKQSIKIGNNHLKIKENNMTNIKDIISKPKMNDLYKNKKIKIIKDNKDHKKIVEINEEELKDNIKRRTFIETNISNKFDKYKTSTNSNKNTNYINNRNCYFSSFIEKYSIKLRNQRNLIKDNNLTSSTFIKTIKKNSTTFALHNKKDKLKEKIFNNQNKINKNKIDKKIKIKTKNEINSKYDITKIISKKSKIQKTKTNLIKPKPNKIIITKIKGKNKIKDKEKEDLNLILDIESERKSSINLINKYNNNNYDVNKPHDYNMKYSLFKEYDDEENKNMSNIKIEKVIIGKIDGYQDIIESDKINDDTNNTNNKTNTKQKNEVLLIFEENLSGFYDLNLENINYKKNENLLNIDNEYDFEDLPTNSNEAKDKDNKNKGEKEQNDKIKINKD